MYQQKRRRCWFTQPKQSLQLRQLSEQLRAGVAAQGRSLKVVMLRVYLALLAAAQKAYEAHPQKDDPSNPADPYMTLLGYFNSLRELGSARRIIEDEVTNRLAGYAARKEPSEGTEQDLFAKALAVEDNAGKSAVVTHADPAAVGLTTWTEWKIPLVGARLRVVPQRCPGAARWVRHHGPRAIVVPRIAGYVVHLALRQLLVGAVLACKEHSNAG